MTIPRSFLEKKISLFSHLPVLSRHHCSIRLSFAPIDIRLGGLEVVQLLQDMAMLEKSTNSRNGLKRPCWTSDLDGNSA